MDVRQFIGQTSTLKKDDFPQPQICTIREVKGIEMDTDEGGKETVCGIFFNEHQKPMVAKTTNLNIAVALFGTPDGTQWIGKQIEVFNDVTVQFRGKVTGGIRLRAPQGYQPPPPAQPPVQQPPQQQQQFAQPHAQPPQQPPVQPQPGYAQPPQQPPVQSNVGQQGGYAPAPGQPTDPFAG